MSRLIALWLIDTAVMINLCFIGFILCVFGFVLYPIKPARQFCGKQAIRVINFTDDFLRSGGEDDQAYSLLAQISKMLVV